MRRASCSRARATGRSAPARSRRARSWSAPARRTTSSCGRCPNSYFTRDPSAWIYGGVVVNPMYWPARRLEALNVETIYRFHPDVPRRGLQVLVQPRGRGRELRPRELRGRRHHADRQPDGRHRDERADDGPDDREDRAVAVQGRARRTASSPPGMTRDRAHMHLDTVFTFLDRDAVTMFPKVVNSITAYSRPAGGQGRRDRGDQGDLLPRRDQGRPAASRTCA